MKVSHKPGMFELVNSLAQPYVCITCGPWENPAQICPALSKSTQQ